MLEGLYLECKCSLKWNHCSKIAMQWGPQKLDCHAAIAHEERQPEPDPTSDRFPDCKHLETFRCLIYELGLA